MSLSLSVIPLSGRTVVVIVIGDIRIVRTIDYDNDYDNDNEEGRRRKPTSGCYGRAGACRRATPLVTPGAVCGQPLSSITLPMEGRRRTDRRASARLFRPLRRPSWSLAVPGNQPARQTVRPTRLATQNKTEMLRSSLCCEYVPGWRWLSSAAPRARNITPFQRKPDQ